MEEDPVVIIGMGMVTALGHSPQETWDALIAGKQGIRPIKRFDAQGFPCRMAALVHGIDEETVPISTKWPRILDLHSLILMKSSLDALQDATLDLASIPSEEIGFFVGMGLVDYREEDLLPAIEASTNQAGELDWDRFYEKGYQEIYPLWPLSMVNNISVCQVAIELGIRGENAVFSAHSVSATAAIAEGIETLYEKNATVVLAGGVSQKVSPASLARAHMQGVLNVSGNTEDLCRPFAATRNGTVLGEGGGMLALTLQSFAQAHHLPFSTAVTGYGEAWGTNERATDPTPQAMARSMTQALKTANLLPGDIDVLIAEGDGTQEGDRNEIEAIHEIFADHLDNIPVYSSKPAIGSLLSGGPAVDVIVGSYIVNQGLVPPMSRPSPVDQAVHFRLTGNRPQSLSAKRVMINCRSCEGHAGTIIVEMVR